MFVAPNGTGYTSIARDDGSYVVEVVRPGDLPEVVRGFASHAEAERWILAQVGEQLSGGLPDITQAAHNPEVNGRNR